MDHASLTSLCDNTRTQVMGIFNATPDSLYDGGKYANSLEAEKRIIQMAKDGADILDLGAESSRPGAQLISMDEELKRLAPVLDLALATGLPVSVDTWKAAVAEYALRRGALVINDITAMRGDPGMAGVVAEHQAVCILMHMQGTPDTMQTAPRYANVITDVYDFLALRAEYAIAHGVREDRIWIDPGFGFGKTLEHNLLLLRHLEQFKRLGFPLLIGPSNKSMIGDVLGLPPEERMEGTAAAVVTGIIKGVHCVRVHDVKTMKRIARMSDAILGKGNGGNE